MCLGATVRVVAIDPASGTATVDDGRRGRVVSLVLRPDTDVGELVVVHTGFVVGTVAGGADPDASVERADIGSQPT